MWAQLCPLTSPNLSRRGSAASPAPRASRRHRRFVLWDAGSRGGAGSSPDHSARTHSPARTAAPARSSPSPASRRTRKRRMRSSSDRPPPSPPANRCCLHVAAPRGSPALLAETSAASPRRGPGGRRGAAGDGGRLGSSAPPCTPLGPPNSAPGKTEGCTCPGGGGGGYGEDEVGSSLPPRRAVDGIEDDGGIREVRTFCFGAAPRLQGAPRGSPPPGMAAPKWGGGGFGERGDPSDVWYLPGSDCGARPGAGGGGGGGGAQHRAAEPGGAGPPGSAGPTRPVGAHRFPSPLQIAHLNREVSQLGRELQRVLELLQGRPPPPACPRRPPGASSPPPRPPPAPTASRGSPPACSRGPARSRSVPTASGAPGLGTEAPRPPSPAAPQPAPRPSRPVPQSPTPPPAVPPRSAHSFPGCSARARPQPRSGSASAR